MPARGTVSIGNKVYAFEPDDSFGVLDWGRGYWLYRNRWYWGSASGLYDGKPVGWNIGYGFTDRTPASENVIFYDGKANKLDEVVFHLNEENYLEPWKFTSNDGRFEIDFEPILDRHSAMKLGIIASIQNQILAIIQARLFWTTARKSASTGSWALRKMCAIDGKACKKTRSPRYCRRMDMKLDTETCLTWTTVLSYSEIAKGSSLSIFLMEERSSTRPGGTGSGLSLKTLKGKRKQDLRFSRLVGLRRRSFFIRSIISFFGG